MIAKESREWSELLVGSRVSLLGFYFLVRIEFIRADLSHVILQIGSEFSYSDGENSVALDPLKPETLGPVLALCGQRLTDFEMDEDGTLRLGFEKGQSIVAGPDEQYEAWTMAAEKGQLGMTFCSVGGGLDGVSGDTDRQMSIRRRDRVLGIFAGDGTQ